VRDIFDRFKEFESFVGHRLKWSVFKETREFNELMSKFKE
jgi:hypothetical protein